MMITIQNDYFLIDLADNQHTLPFGFRITACIENKIKQQDSIANYLRCALEYRIGTTFVEWYKLLHSLRSNPYDNICLKNTLKFEMHMGAINLGGKWYHGNYLGNSFLKLISTDEKLAIFIVASSQYSQTFPYITQIDTKLGRYLWLQRSHRFTFNTKIISY